MKTSNTYTIEEPCTQNWGQMEKRAGERFCESCQKCVIDFSGYSTIEIIQKLNNATTAVCGRLSQAQLNQLNYHLVVSSPKRSWMKYLGVLAIGVSILAQDGKAFAQTESIKIERSGYKQSDTNKPQVVKKIYGYIVNEEKKPVVGAKISIDQTKLFAITDKDGRYEIKLAANFNPKFKQMNVVHEGAVLAKMTFDYATEKQEQIKVWTSPMIMGKIAIQSIPAVKLVNP